MKDPVVVMIVEPGRAGELLVTRATLGGEIVTQTARNPLMLDTVDLLVELVSTGAPATGAVLVLPGPLDFGDIHAACAVHGRRSGSAVQANETGWSRLTGGGKPSVIVCDRHTNDRAPSTLMPTGEDAIVIAGALAAYQRAVGYPWYSTGAVTGCIALQGFWKAGKSHPHMQTRVSDKLPQTAELHYYREPKDKAEHGWPHGVWDGRKYALNAQGTLRLSMDNLAYRRTDVFTGEPGYWKIDARMVISQLTHRFGVELPPLIDFDIIHDDGTAELQASTMTLLFELGLMVDVMGVTTSAAGWYGYPLRPLMHRIRDAVYAGPFMDDNGDNYTPEDLLVGAAFKDTYSRPIAMIGGVGGVISRRDWSDAYEDHMRASIMRRVCRVHARCDGLLPVKITRDGVVYAAKTSEELDRVHAVIGVGDRIGNMRRIR